MDEKRSKTARPARKQSSRAATKTSTKRTPRTGAPALELVSRTEDQVSTAAEPAITEPMAAAVAHDEVSEDEIRRRAYEIFLARGGAGGDDLADWLEAERQIRLARGAR